MAEEIPAGADQPALDAKPFIRPNSPEGRAIIRRAQPGRGTVSERRAAAIEAGFRFGDYQEPPGSGERWITGGRNRVIPKKEEEYEWVRYWDGQPLQKVRKASIYGALATTSEDPAATAQQITQELKTGQTSPTFEKVKEEVQQQTQQEIVDAVEESASVGDTQTTADLIVTQADLAREFSNVRVRALENASLDSSSENKSISNENYQKWYLSRLHDMAAARAKVNQIINRAAAKGSLEATDLAMHLGEVAILPGEQIAQGFVAKEILGEHYTVLAGEQLKDLADWILSHPPEEQAAAAQRVVDSYMKHSGITHDNDVVRGFALQTLQEYINTPNLEGEGIPWSRYIDNTFGIVDITPFFVVKGVRRGLEAIFKADKVGKASNRGQSAIDEISEANPDLASDLIGDGIENEAVAEALDDTSSGLVQRALPQATFDGDTVYEGAPLSLVDKMKGLSTKADQITKFVDNTFLYTDADYKKTQERLLEVLSRDDLEAVARPSASAARRDGDSNSIILEATYGQNSDLPLDDFETALELKATLKNAYKAEGLDVDPMILVKNSETGAFENIIGSGETSGRYLVKVDTSYPMQSSDIVPEHLSDRVRTGVGKVKTWFMDPQSYLSRTLLKGANIANEKKHFFVRELKSLLAPLNKLGFTGQSKVSDLLKRGELEKTVYTYNQLKRDYTLPEIEAYYAARLVNDLVYGIKNEALRNRLIAGGFLDYRVMTADGQVFQNVVKPIKMDELPPDAKVAWDVKTGQEVSLIAKGAIDDLYSQGLMVAKVLRKARSGKSDYNYVVVKPDETGPLPPNVIYKHAGYNLRVNSDPWFIDKTEMRRVDGVLKPVTSTIGVARSSRELRATLQKLRAVDPENVYDHHIDRAISSDESLLKQDMDRLDGSGLQYYFSGRGDRLTRSDGSVSAVENPVNAMNSLIGSVANGESHQKLVETAVERHRKTHGTKLGPDNLPLWLWDKNNKTWQYRGKEFNEASHPELKDANRDYEYIEGLKDHRSAVDKAWQDFMVDLSFTLGKGKITGGKLSTDLLLKGLSQLTPGRALRGLTFALTLPLQPFRQLLLQWGTGLHLTGIDPAATALAYRDSILTTISMSSWDSPTRWKMLVEPLAKLNGWDPAEWKTVFDEFRRTGKAYSIDSNVVIGEANFGWSKSLADSKLQRAGQLVSNTLKSPVAIGKDMGFNLGEFGNQGFSWHFARRQHIKNNPGKAWNADQRSLDEIAAQARNYSINMTKTSAFPYQQGAFATMTQFMSINHKMALKMLPTSLGGDPDLAGVRGRYVTGALLMYGAAGVGMHEIYQSWKDSNNLDIPPELDRAFQGGLMSALVLGSLELALKEERGSLQTDLSGSMSAGSGIVSFMPDLINNIMEGNPLEALAGASGNVLPRIGRVYDHIQSIWGFTEMDTSEKLVKSLTHSAGEIGIFSNAFKYNLAMAYKGKMDELHVVSTKGSVGPPITEPDLWLKTIFGFGLKSETELYNQWLSLKKDWSSSGKKHIAQIDKDGKRVAEWMFKMWLESADEYEFEEKVRPIMWTLHNGDRTYGVRVYEAAKAHFRRDPKFSNFIDKIVTDHALNDPDADIKALQNLVTNSRLIPEDDKALIVEKLGILGDSRQLSEQHLQEAFK
jgi:galactitol-specific phosphotransferase system IIB component